MATGAKSSVAIIVPAYNRVEWLRECLLAVLGQTFTDFRLIVVDDGSTPPLAEQPMLAAITQDPRVTLIRKENGGPASARNLALDMLDDGYVLVLDSDDILEPSAVETLLGAARGTGADFIAGSWTGFSVTPEQRQIRRVRIKYRDAYANCVEQGWPIGTVMLRDDPGTRYNEARMPWEALEFYLDYLAPGRSAAYLDAVIVNMRQHESPDRLTIKHDHFEPYNTGSFFAEKKSQLQSASLLNTERASALDQRILSSVHSLLCSGRVRHARELFREVNWELIDRYPWFRPASFASVSKRIGFAGAQSLIFANRLLGRA